MKRILNTTLALAIIASTGIPYSTAFALSQVQSGSAQQSQPQTGVMSLQQVLEYVHSNSPEMGIEQSKYRQSKFATDEVRAKLGWQVTAEANAGVFWNSGGKSVTKTDAAGNSTTSDKADTGVAVNAFIVAEKDIYNPAVKAQIKSKQIEEAIVRQQSYLTQTDVLSLTIQAYVDLVIKGKILDENVKIVGGLGAVSGAAYTQYKIGFSSIVDSLQATTATAQQKIQIVKAERDYNQAKVTFERVTGLNAQVVSQDLTQLIPFFDRVKSFLPTDMETAMFAASQNNPLGRVATLQNALADSRLNAVRKERGPVVSLVGQIGVGNDDTVGNNESHKFGAAAYAGVRVRYKLYDGGELIARAGQAEEAGIQARYAQILATREIGKQVKSSWYDYHNYSSKLTNLSNELLRQAQAQVGQISEEQKSGLRTMVELINATVLPGQAKIQLLEAQQVTLISRVQVLQAVGELTAETFGLSGGTHSAVATPSAIPVLAPTK